MTETESLAARVAEAMEWRRGTFRTPSIANTPIEVPVWLDRDGAMRTKVEGWDPEHNPAHWMEVVEHALAQEWCEGFALESPLAGSDTTWRCTLFSADKNRPGDKADADTPGTAVCKAFLAARAAVEDSA